MIENSGGIAVFNSEPAKKLLEAIYAAIGKLYEPVHHKRMTDAEIYRIREYTKAIKENIDVPITYKDDHLQIDGSDFEALRNRAGSRLAYQEITKQENIETIANKAFAELEGKESQSQSDEKISPEWMNRFINTAGEISTEEMQNLWAKVLAGEAVKPNSYSLRTLECLRNLSVDDAKLFEKISEFILEEKTLFNDRELNAKYGISFNDILQLGECGLLNTDAFLSSTVNVHKQPIEIIDFGEYFLLASSNEEIGLTFWHYPLSRAGRELLRVARKKNYSLEYIKDVISSIKKNNTKSTLILRKVASRCGNTINFVPDNASVWP